MATGTRLFPQRASIRRHGENCAAGEDANKQEGIFNIPAWISCFLICPGFLPYLWIFWASVTVATLVF
jgi:hypothetical protein